MYSSLTKTNNTPQGITKDINSNDYSNDYTNDYTNSSYTSSNYFRIGMIFIILLFLGINVFSHLGDFFQNLKDTTAPVIEDILKNLGFVITETSKDATEITAKGAKLGIDVAAGTVESGIDVIQGQLDIEHSQHPSLNKTNMTSKNNGNSNGNKNSTNSDFMSKSLTSALADAEYNSEPLPDDATSSTQRNGSSKTGYCYIGEDRGFRSCISVKESDVCMSGEIFPTNQICVNPSLRE
tara:strand:+ start:486 stop:1199 length:714 start_codon:yes stop_codon:yes gene_type:complete